MQRLCAVRITVRHAPADADYLIVRTAIDAATIRNVVVVGHTYKIVKNCFRLDVRKHFFSNRVVDA